MSSFALRESTEAFQVSNAERPIKEPAHIARQDFCIPSSKEIISIAADVGRAYRLYGLACYHSLLDSREGYDPHSQHETPASRLTSAKCESTGINRGVIVITHAFTICCVSDIHASVRQRFLNTILYAAWQHPHTGTTKERSG